jgi:hypothetical protein
MEATHKEQYDYYMEELKKYKTHYEKNGTYKDQKIKTTFILTHFNDKKDNLLINEKNNNNFDNITINGNNEIDLFTKKTSREPIDNLNASPLSSKEFHLETINDCKNEFCGKKRKFYCKRVDLNESETKVEI